MHDVVDRLPALFGHIADLDEVAQLLIISLRIRVNHLFRLAPCIDKCTHIVAHHVAVEHAGLPAETILGKAIVVVPRLNVGNDAVFGDFRLDGSHLFIIAYHLPHVFF